MKHYFVLLLLTLSSCSPYDDSGIYTLYRGSILGDLRIHMATFDADEGESYNSYNCQLTADLIMAIPGVEVKYWCEKGRFRE